MLKNSFKDCRSCTDHQEMMEALLKLIPSDKLESEKAHDLINFFASQCCLLHVGDYENTMQPFIKEL